MQEKKIPTKKEAEKLNFLLFGLLRKWGKKKKKVIKSYVFKSLIYAIYDIYVKFDAYNR